MHLYFGARRLDFRTSDVFSDHIKSQFFSSLIFKIFIYSKTSLNLELATKKVYILASFAHAHLFHIYFIRVQVVVPKLPKSGQDWVAPTVQVPIRYQEGCLSVPA